MSAFQKGYVEGYKLPLARGVRDGMWHAWGDRDEFYQGLLEGRLDKLAAILDRQTDQVLLDTFDKEMDEEERA